MPRVQYDRTKVSAARSSTAPVPAREKSPDRCGTCDSRLTFDTDGNGGTVVECPKGHPQKQGRSSTPSPVQRQAPSTVGPCHVDTCPGFGKPQERATCAFCDRREAWARAHQVTKTKSCSCCGGDFAARGKTEYCKACRPLVNRVKAKQALTGAAQA